MGKPEQAGAHLINEIKKGQIGKKKKEKEVSRSRQGFGDLKM